MRQASFRSVEKQFKSLSKTNSSIILPANYTFSYSVLVLYNNNHFTVMFSSIIVFY